MKACRAHVCTAALPCNSDHKIIDRKYDVAKETMSWWLQQRPYFSRYTVVAYTLHSQVSWVVPLCGVTTFFSREEEVSKLMAAETYQHYLVQTFQNPVF